MQSGITKLDIQTAAQFDDHNCTVWRICWNVTGTVLASSGDDGCVRMFKSKYCLNLILILTFSYLNRSVYVSDLFFEGTISAKRCVGDL